MTNSSIDIVETTLCPVCTASMLRDKPFWIYRCTSCGYLRSNLTPEIRSHNKLNLDEKQREIALKRLRHQNFERIFSHLAEIPLTGKQLLDVGCAHGWFLEAAQSHGYLSYGIEPDAEMALYARQHGLNVQEGFFPDDLNPALRFDVIVFNDVFEHLPDVTSAIQSCHRLLNPGGIVVINLPLSSGAFYKMAQVLDRAGFHGPFDRMWQRYFPSPHISYFQSHQLEQFSRRHGFSMITYTSLHSIEVDGLWERLRYDKSNPVIIAIFIYVVLLMINPIIRYLPADIGLHIFQKQ